MLQDFLETLNGHTRVDVPQLSFSTQFSAFGVTKAEKLGLEGMHLCYNRFPAMLAEDFLIFNVDGDDSQKSRENHPLDIQEEGNSGFEGKIAFLDTDILCYHIKAVASNITATLNLPATDPAYPRKLQFDQDSRLLTIETQRPRSDMRDPDPEHPFTICIMVPKSFDEIKGSFKDTDSAVRLELAAANGVTGEETFVVGIGEGPTAAEIKDRMLKLSKTNSEASSKASLTWLKNSLRDFTFDGIQQHLKLHYAKAAYQILCNTLAPRGQIKHNAIVPCRGTYCAHYLWDACFTNLGVAQFNQQLAEESLRILCETQEQDGKIPHFVCATWNRPGETQPPLIAWSAWRLYEQFGNKQFIEDIYVSLCRYADWWFANRDDDKDGLVEYQHRLESGWDDSPRFEKGRIAAIDLNSYLNREIKLISKMADLLGKNEESAKWQKRASEHEEAIMNRMFDKDSCVFFDRLVKEDKLLKLLTPASFMPLWTGVSVPKETAQQMIVKYLINPKYFYGSVPFPVVAYCEPTYMPEKWWRGPTWPNIAYAMTEILRIHGFQDQYKEALNRLLNMMTAHDEMNELYSSNLGEPLGAPGLCWGDAVFMELARMASK